MRTQRLAKIINMVLLGFFCALPALLIRTIQSSVNCAVDAHYMLLTGEYIVKHGIPYTNPFTYDTDLSFVCQNWLSSVLYWILYRRFDVYGLFLYTMLIAMIFGGLIFWYLHKRTNHIVISFVGSELVLLEFFALGGFRNHLFSGMLLWIEILLLEQYRSKRSAQWLLPLPFLAALEVNYHASYYWFFLLFLLPYLVPGIKNPWWDWKKEMPGSRKQLLLTMFLMLAAGLCNPYGIDNMFYLIRSFMGFQEIYEVKTLIEELTPPTPFSAEGMLLFGLGAIFFFMKKEKIDSAHFYLWLGCLLFGLCAERNIALACIGSLCLLGDLVAAGQLEFPQKAYRILLPYCFIAIILTMLSIPHLHIQNFDHALDDYFAYLETQEDVQLYSEFRVAAQCARKGYPILMDCRPEIYTKAMDGPVSIAKSISYLDRVPNPIVEETFENLQKKYDFNYFLVNEYSTICVYLEGSEEFEEVAIGPADDALRLFKKTED